MTIYRPELVSGDKVPMVVTNPKHMVPLKGSYTASGAAISEMGEKIGAEAVLRSGGFEDAMLRALDKVSGSQQFSADLSQRAITDPGSVDIHDITIAQAKARMSLDITRTILNRIVQGWRDLINTR
ncbi:MAG: flagellar hook-basal body complex protein FliE [Spirochaetaceae bacterium]|jgi:flagellar hook-basal body complex protein FliE|nr:flagellar hook-basal body complex protein FliE [Spirochaetaceae bacterium]